MSLASAAWARLAADATLTALLATYNGAPAIVVADDGALPEDIPTPFVAVLGPESDEPNDCKVERGRDQTLLVRTYADNTGSTLAITAIAERVRDLFHREPDGLAVGAYAVDVSGPVIAPTDARLYGRQLDVRVLSLDDA